MVSEPGSFAYRTMTTRFPAIVQNVLADHAGQYPDSIKRNLQALHDELAQNQVVSPLETAAPDGPDWQAVWQPHRGKRWLELPWYFAEAFFYRRLLEAANYFGSSVEAQRRRGEAKSGGEANISGRPSPVPGQTLAPGANTKDWVGVDPYLPRKQAELAGELPWQVLAAALAHAPDGSTASLGALLHHCVWGNRVDLSYTKVMETSGGRITLAREQENLVVDDTEAVLDYLQRRRTGANGQAILTADGQPSAAGGRIDFICDNAGTELLMDLALADFLLHWDWAQQVTLHVKAHPTYVSDATVADVTMTIAAMKARQGAEFGGLATRLERYLAQSQLQLRSDIFWNSSRFFWEIPPALQTELSQAALVIIKGDANYRRLLGDSRWPTTVPFVQAAPYFPAPFVTLRTLKSDPIVGLPPGLAEQLDRLDAEWRVNGQRGVIQFVSSQQDS